jgi:hypothetical protein
MAIRTLMDIQSDVEAARFAEDPEAEARFHQELDEAYEDMELDRED